MTTITGRDALILARALSMPLCKHAEPSRPGRDDLTLEEAERVVARDPELVYVEVDARVFRGLETAKRDGVSGAEADPDLWYAEPGDYQGGVLYTAGHASPADALLAVLLTK